ncbi:MAG: hypothetical protein EZS28_041476, partial [Streblomastix strix]
AEEKETKTFNKAIDVDYDELFDIDFDPEKTNERELFVEVLDKKKKKYYKEEDKKYESDEDDYDYEDEGFIRGVAIPFGRYFLNPQKLHLNLIGDQDEGQNEAAGDIYIQKQCQRTIKALRKLSRLKIPSPEAIAAHIKERERREQETDRRHKNEEPYFVPGDVYVYLEELSEINPFDVGGKSDPYVVLSLAGQEFRTEVAHNTLNLFLSNLENPEEQLREIEEYVTDEFLHLGIVLFETTGERKQEKAEIQEEIRQIKTR